VPAEVAVGLHGDEGPGRRQPRQRLAQVLAHRAADLARVLDDRVERTVLADPLAGGLRADLLDARHVVDGIADERQVIDDPLRRHAELLLHARGVEPFVAHRVDERDVLVDELREVLVAGRHDGLHSVRRRPPGERRDHVVRLDALDLDHRPAERPRGLVDRLDLQGEVVGHRLAVGLVLGVHVVAEGLSLGVEHAREIVRMDLLAQRAQHADESADRPGRLAARGPQIRKRVESAV
jgi:hypothetical protein